jgi:hypothetical protein
MPGQLVLFNRFYQPDFDIDSRTVAPAIALSTPNEIRLPLMWIAMLYGRVSMSLAATTGVHSHVEAIKYLMAGADVVMSTSAVLQQGPAFFARLLKGMTAWMEAKGYASVAQMRGSMSQQSVKDSTAFVRANFPRRKLASKRSPVSARAPRSRHDFCAAFRNSMYEKRPRSHVSPAASACRVSMDSSWTCA